MSLPSISTRLIVVCWFGRQLIIMTRCNAWFVRHMICNHINIITSSSVVALYESDGWTWWCVNVKYGSVEWELRMEDGVHGWCHQYRWWRRSMIEIMAVSESITVVDCCVLSLIFTVRCFVLLNILMIDCCVSWLLWVVDCCVGSSRSSSSMLAGTHNHTMIYAPWLIICWRTFWHYSLAIGL